MGIISVSELMKSLGALPACRAKHGLGESAFKAAVVPKLLEELPLFAKECELVNGDALHAPRLLLRNAPSRHFAVSGTTSCAATLAAKAGPP